MSPRNWDARTYDRVADPMTRWGESVLDRLPLRGDERVLDAGCGSGRVTELLLRRLGSGSVVALDASPNMIEAARARLAPYGDRVSYLLADLGQPIPLDGPVDAVLSTATFHWVPDHDALFGGLAAVLRPGGWLVAQCGGEGNLATVMRALDEVGEPWRPWNFQSPEATRVRLGSAGFVDVECWLHDEPTPIAPAELETYLATIVLGANLERLSPDRRADYVHAVAQRLPAPTLDYVRLNIVARRAV